MRKTFRIKIKYRLLFESVFHCGSGTPEGLIDRTVVKDKDGFLFIPGSTIKGVLRENCELIAKMFNIPVNDPHDASGAVKAFQEAPGIVEEIFGSRRREADVFFDNAYMPESSGQGKTWENGFDKAFFNGPEKNKRFIQMQIENRTQTSISRRTGIVKPQNLFTSEFGIPGVVFKGKIHGCITGLDNELSDREGPFSLNLLIAGMLNANRIGANRSTGAGRCRFVFSEFSVDGKKQSPNLSYDDLESFILYNETRAEQ